MLSQGGADEDTDEFHDPTDEGAEDARLPRERGIVRLAVDGCHDKKDEGEEADGVDAVGQGGDVIAPLAFGDFPGLPGEEEIAREDGECGAGEDLGGDLSDAEAAEHRTKGEDQQELQEIVDEEAEEAVEIAFADAEEPGRGCHACDESRMCASWEAGSAEGLRPALSFVAKKRRNQGAEVG